jgi:2-oxoglutarate ferredoxin oxidoreductase subunit alpha
MGPATGAATQSAQGDLLFSTFSNSGAYPVPVFSPSNIKDCFKTVIHAINVSEILRTPVILLTEKEITMTYETVDRDEIEIPERFERKIFSRKNFKTHNFEKPSDIPLFSSLGKEYQVRATGSAHDKKGFLKKDDPEVIEVLKHLESKIIDNIENYNLYEYYEGSGDILLISYGVTSKSAIEAFEIIKKSRDIGLLIMKLLYPIPLNFLKSIINNYKKVFVVEENMTGQYAMLLNMNGLLYGKELVKINKIGDLISPSEILESIEQNE